MSLEKYGAGQDPYCYAGSATLKNRLGIQNEIDLANAERDLSALAADRIEFSAPPYDFSFLKLLHQKLFKDIYSWAGEVRSVDISKGDTRFCATHRIEPEAEKLFHALADNNWLMNRPRDELILEIAEFCGDLNVIHPFREGNGRALRLLCEFVIVNSGYEISWQNLSEEEWLQASIDAVNCNQPSSG